MRKPFYMKKCKAWYVWHNGKQVRLSHDKEEAFQTYHELKSQNAPISNSDTVASLLNAYLEWCSQNRSEKTYDWYRLFLSSFARFVGATQRISDLKPFHVTKWLAANDWSNTTQHNVTRALKRAFNWARREGRLSHNPIQAAQTAAPERREIVLSPDEYDLVYSVASDDAFRDYLTILHETGCRPQEAKAIEARHCQLDISRIVFPAKESKGKRFPRVIYLTEAAHQLVERLCEQFPEGPILRNADGEPWHRNAVRCRFRRMNTKLGKKRIDGLCATVVRHSFATEGLKNGVDPVTLAVLMGHADASMLAKTYQHLAADPTFLSSAMKRARSQDD